MVGHADSQRDGLRIGIDWNQSIGAGYVPKVALRLDDGVAREEDWSLSTTNVKATVAPGDYPAILEEMKVSDRLLARLTTVNGENITAQWHLAGFAAAFKPLEEKCASVLR